MRGADHGDVVSDVVGVLGEAQGLDGGLDAGSGDEHLVVGGGIAGGLEGGAALVVGEEDGLAGGSEDDDARGGRARIVLDVLLELAVIDAAVRVERGGDRGEDSV